MRRLSVLPIVLLAVAVPLHADALSDVRGALSRLGATSPIRVTYEVQRNEVSEGKFENVKYGGKAAIDIESDGSSVKLVITRPMLESVEKELDARAKDPNLPSPNERALSEISSVVAAQSIDAAPALLRLMDDAKVVSDAAGTWAGKPARVVVLTLAARKHDGPGKVTMLEDKLTLWVGGDHVPLAAEHIRAAKFSFLIFKTDQRTKRSWHYARSADRLVTARFEETENLSGMGQKGNDSLVATVRVHG